VRRRQLSEQIFLSVDWQSGLCRSHSDPDLWFEDVTEDIAVKICRGDGVGQLPCPIREVCLQFALDTQQIMGVWGGFTADQRRVVGWTKSRVKCPDCGSKDVESHQDRHETCVTCGLSWSV
jgi:WhiB family transcriptional regulator, redox-sensing transcriptional regulator